MAEAYLALSRSDRLEALRVATTASGRPVYLLEKDIWVVWALQGLFSSALGDDGEPFAELLERCAALQDRANARK